VLPRFSNHDTMTTIGIGGCYKGLSATIIKQGSNQAIRFLRNGDPEGLVSRRRSEEACSKVYRWGFRAFAGAASVFGNTPIDVVKTRMQVRGESFSVFPDMERNISFEPSTICYLYSLQ